MPPPPDPVRASLGHGFEIGAALGRDNFIAQAFFLRLKADINTPTHGRKLRVAHGFFPAGRRIGTGIGREDRFL